MCATLTFIRSLRPGQWLTDMVKTDKIFSINLVFQKQFYISVDISAIVIN